VPGDARVARPDIAQVAAPGPAPSLSFSFSDSLSLALSLFLRETGILLPNNQRQHRTSHAPKDVLPLRICANYCAPCQPLLRAFSGWIRSPPPTPSSPTLHTPNQAGKEDREAVAAINVEIEELQQECADLTDCLIP